MRLKEWDAGHKATDGCRTHVAKKKPTFKDPFPLYYFNVSFPLNVYFGVSNPSKWPPPIHYYMPKD